MESTGPLLDGPVVTTEGSSALPGFVDIQVNGGWGHDFTADPATIWEVGRRLPATGVTGFLPTIVSASGDTYEQAMEVVRAGPPSGYKGAEVIGLHFEGPWLSPSMRGAHDPGLLEEPDAAVARGWAESGVVTMVTMAPERPGAPEVATLLAESGVVVSVGHTDATYETAMAAIEGPWSTVTHLFNQMSGFHHRAPGVVGAALTGTAPAGVIADGIHCHPAALKLAWELLGGEGLFLITDAMAATGLGSGEFRLGNLEVTVRGGDGPRMAGGGLAGSVLTMDRAVANLATWLAIPLEEAARSASTTPAGLLGLQDRGRLAAGLRADFVVVDSEGRVVETHVGGELVFAADQASGRRASQYS